MIMMCATVIVIFISVVIIFQTWLCWEGERGIAARRRGQAGSQT